MLTSEIDKVLLYLHANEGESCHKLLYMVNMHIQGITQSTPRLLVAPPDT